MRTLLLLLALLAFACESKNKTIRKEYIAEGFYEEGEATSDSIFHGKVNQYDLAGKKIGSVTYFHGIKHGPGTTLYANGMLHDSINYRYGKMNGMAYVFDSLGNLFYKANHIDGRIVGHICRYMPGNKLVEYSFRDFEGNFVYNLSYRDEGLPLEIGEMPIYSTDTTSEDGQRKLHIFLYLIIPPDLKMHYEIAKVHNKNKVVWSQPITNTETFYETTLEFPEKDHHYAIVMSIFNTAKGKNDLRVYLLN